MSQSNAPPKNAIVLGDGKWIEHVELTGLYDRAVNIDPLLGDLEPMWSALETECVAACCGFDAFDFSADNIAKIKANLNVAEVVSRIEKLRSALAGQHAEVVVSSRLNNYAHQSVFDALLVHLESNFGDY